MPAAWVGAVVLAIAADAADRGMTLIADGGPQATIVLSVAPGDVARTAARDLQDYLLKMSGVKLPIQETDALPDANTILIGDSAAARQLVGPLLSEKHLGPDGFIVKTFPNRLVLVGRKAHASEYPYHGTRYAVFALLEQLGCRFFALHPDGEHIPQRQVVAVSELDIVSKADFTYRDLWFNGNVRPTLTAKTRQAWSDWMMKNRMGWVSRIRHGHAYDQWCPTDRYFDKHPEYFSYSRDRQQRLPMTAQEGQVCHSNPDVVNLAVAAARKFLDNPLERYFSMSPADTEEWCECDACLAMDDPDPTVGLATRVLQFTNQVAAEVSKTHPGRVLPYLAEYGNLPGPPVRRDGTIALKVHPAVLPVVVMGKRFCVLHDVHDETCPTNVDHRRRLLSWQRVAPQMMFYEWVQPAHRLSTPQTWLISPRIRYYRDLGGIGYSGEVLGYSPDNDLTMYITARMLWDADQDETALIDEFFALYFQEAAAPMAAYYSELNKVGRRPGLHTYNVPFDAWTPAVFETLFPYLDKAAALAVQPHVGRRIGRDRAALEVYQLFMIARKAEQHWHQSSTPENKAAGLQAVDKAIEFLSAIADQDIVADTWLRDGRLMGMQRRLLAGNVSEPISAKTLEGWSDEETFGDLWKEFEEVVPIPHLWKFRIDPEETGEADGWFADTAPGAWEDIRIGEFWEMQGHPTYNGDGWYRLRLDIPAAARGRQLLLYFGAADENAHLWVNGKKAGFFDIGGDVGWDKRFAIDITEFARPGEENLIAVRVSDTMQMGGLWKSAKLVSPKVEKDQVLDLGGGLTMEFVWIEAIQCWVGKYEVTNAQYRRFKPDHDSQAFTHSTTKERLSLNGDRQPAVYVSYEQAAAFADWLGTAADLPDGYRVRLPTGSEWMTFAQCGDGRKYPWGNDWPPPGGWNYQGSEGAAGGPKIDEHNDGHPVTCAVDKSGRSSWGLYGVGGNVWEWTSEQNGKSRVIRGVSWNYSEPNSLRCDQGHLNIPSDRGSVIGLRLVIGREPVRFEDVTEAMGLPVDGNGAAWIDYDNDGWTDLQMGGVVYRNDAGKRFAKTSYSRGEPYCWCDFDNDGYLDFFGANSGELGFGSVDGSFTMAELPSKPMDVSEGAACIDMNGDGLVDIYWGGYETWGKVAAYPDVIFTNQGNRAFKLTWMQEPPHLQSRGIAAADYNNDGAGDIYVSNYRLSPNILWRNNGDLSGTFTSAAAECGVLGGNGHSISAAWGDLDNDGLLDLFAGNFAHGGQPESQFLRNLGTFDGAQDRPANGYTFENRGPSGVRYQESYADPALGDYDNDGDLDLFFTTAYENDNSALFSNDSNGYFYDVTSEAGLLGSVRPTHMVAWGDYDNDGDLDLMAGGRLFRNTLGSGQPSNNWIKVKLQGTHSTGSDSSTGRVNRAAIGTIVRIKLADRILTRQVEAGAGHNANDLTLHFGLGSYSGDVDLEISWPWIKTKQTVTATANSVVTVACNVGVGPMQEKN